MVHNSAKTKDSNINARGELCVGNRRGLSFSGLPAQLRELKDDIAKLGEKVALTGDRLTELEDKALALEHLTTESRRARIQPTNTLKRDKLDTWDDDSDGEIIWEEYMAGEESKANAIADAALYPLKDRSDVHIFEELYGLEPMQVLRISECYLASPPNLSKMVWLT